MCAADAPDRPKSANSKQSNVPTSVPIIGTTFRKMIRRKYHCPVKQSAVGPPLNAAILLPPQDPVDASNIDGRAPVA
jgi:hypothetical protein